MNKTNALTIKKKNKIFDIHKAFGLNEIFLWPTCLPNYLPASTLPMHLLGVSGVFHKADIFIVIAMFIVYINYDNVRCSLPCEWALRYLNMMCYPPPPSPCSLLWTHSLGSSWVSIEVLHEIEVIFKKFQQNIIANGMCFHRAKLCD